MSLALEEAQLATLISESIRTSERSFTVYAPAPTLRSYTNGAL